MLSLSVVVVGDSLVSPETILNQMPDDVPALKLAAVASPSDLQRHLEEGKVDLAIVSSELTWSPSALVCDAIRARWPDCEILPGPPDIDGGFGVQMALALKTVTLKRELDAAQLRYHGLLDGLPIGVFRTTPDGRMLEANESMVLLAGFESREQLMAVRSVDFYVNPEDRTRLAEELERHGVVHDFFTLFRRPGNGLHMWVEINAHVVRDEDGRVLYWEGSIQDVTRRKHAEDALRESEAQFRVLIDKAMDTTTVLDYNGNCMYKSESVDYAGWSAEEIVGTSFLDFMHPDDRDEIKRGFAEIRDAVGRTLTIEHRVKYKDGTWGYLESRVTNLLDDPHIRGIVVNSRNITDRRRAEDALKASERRFRMLADNARDLVYRFRFGENSGFDYVSPAVLALTGYTQEEMYANKDLVHSLFHEDDWHILQTLCSSPADLPPRTSTRWVRKDGSVLWVEMENVVQFDSFGDVVAVEGIARDITERKQAEEALRQARDELELRVVERTSALSASNALLRGEIAERAREQQLSEALNSINLVINSSLDSEEIMSRVVGEAVKAIGADKGGINLRRGTRWLVTHQCGFAESMVGREFTEQEFGVNSLAARLEQSIVVHDVETDNRCNKEVMRACDIRSCLMAPLYVRGQVMGNLVLAYSYAPLPLTSNQVDFATKLAASVSLALSNAQMYEAQHEMAEALQDALLAMPRRITGLSFGHLHGSATRQARIGGDFYDLFELAAGKIGITVGDVAGKGVQAASLASLAKNTIKAFAHEKDSPAVTLAKTNEVILRNSDALRYVTVFFAILDVTAGVFSYCSGGHPPAIMVYPDASPRFLEVRSPVLGAFARAEYTSGTETLRPEDVLLLYTDGVTEARSNEEFFGERRLLDLVKELRKEPAASLPSQIYDRVIEFTKDGLQDDVAILAVSLKTQ